MKDWSDIFKQIQLYLNVYKVGKAAYETFHGVSDNSATYSEYEIITDEYMRKLERLKTEDRLRTEYSSVRMMGLIDALTTNALAMARRVISDKVPRRVNAQIFIFDKEKEELILWKSTGVQSIHSVEPWNFRGNTQSECVSHDGICVRAFCSGKTEKHARMEGISLRQNEPIKGIISEPILHRHESSHHDIVVLNIISMKRSGYIPEGDLSKEQRSRLNQVKALLLTINSMNRALKVDWVPART